MKRKYRLKKWAQTVYASVAAVCFCFLVGLSTVEFSFWTIVIIFAVMAIFGACMCMLGMYGREE